MYNRVQGAFLLSSKAPKKWNRSMYTGTAKGFDLTRLLCTTPTANYVLMFCSRCCTGMGKLSRYRSSVEKVAFGSFCLLGISSSYRSLYLCSQS